MVAEYEKLRIKKITTDAGIRLLSQPEGRTMIQLVIATLAICGLVYTGK